MLAKARKCSSFVAPHQARVADNVCSENRRQFALLTGHGTSPVIDDADRKSLTPTRQSSGEAGRKMPRPNGPWGQKQVSRRESSYPVRVIRVGLVIFAACPIYTQHQTFPEPVGTSLLGHQGTNDSAAGGPRIISNCLGLLCFDRTAVSYFAFA